MTPQETEELFKELKQFKSQGHTIIFISHKLNEVKEICDRLTIMKHGRSSGPYRTEGMSEEDISKLIVGRDNVTTIEKKKADPGETILNVNDITTYEDGRQLLKHVNLKLQKGIILGVAGVEGNGQQELAECIAGLRHIEDGSITFNGTDITKMDARRIREQRISYISDDRIGEGTAGEASIESNIIADKLLNKKMMKGIFIDQKKCTSFVEEQMKEYDIVADSEKQPVKMLSGGNMQKVVIARELSDDPLLLIANQPTRGVDVGAMHFIHEKMIQLRDQGTAILMVSADLNEVLEVSDAIIVMFDGEIAAYFKDASQVSEEELGYYMLGVKKESKELVEKKMEVGL